MSEPTMLVPVGSHRSALTGLELPSPPPTRIYISGYEYRVQAPRVALPPLANAIKVILKYGLTGGRVANNILHLLGRSGLVTSDVATLQRIADFLKNTLTTGSSAIPNQFTGSTSLQSVTCKDLGGTTAQATSTGPPVAGVAVGNGHPPQVAMTISWKIAESYRGGKPRTYVPQPPISASVPAGSATIDPAFASAADATWSSFMSTVNAHVDSGGGSMTLGTISYYSSHALRPQPLFRTFIDVKVHERLDSQRRRSGQESLYQVTP